MAIRHVYVDVQVAHHPVVSAFSRHLSTEPEIMEDPSALYRSIKKAGDPWARGKELLLLTRNKGAFLKACPGTREYTCCGYQILHIGSYCTMDCSFCILQSYFHPPILQYFVNHEDLMSELDHAFGQPGIHRMGTGEFTDSLIWEQWSDLTPRLIRRFSGQSRAVLELKTKTTAVQRLQGLPHNRKTIIAWSLNTPRVIATQERGTASLKSRLRAAAQCRSWGYPLAFHFDPLVIYPGCEDEYRLVLEELFTALSPKDIVWISMGTFRFMPALKPVIEQRFPRSKIVYGEFIPGLDGKMRYFKPLRTALYRFMAQSIDRLAPGLTTYLCMEDDQVWTQSMGYTPQSRGGLPAILDESARRHCGLAG
ncbi:MAG: DNA photolyase [Acidobacteriota bacterium]